MVTLYFTKQTKMLPARNFGGTLNTADIVTPFTDYSQWERKSSRRALAKPKAGDRITLPGPVCAHGHVRKYPPGTSDGYIPPQSSLQGKPSSRILTKRPPRPRILEPSSIRLLKVASYVLWIVWTGDPSLLTGSEVQTHHCSVHLPVAGSRSKKLFNRISTVPTTTVSSNLFLVARQS